MKKFLKSVKWVFQNVSKFVIFLLVFLLTACALTILYIFPAIDKSTVVHEDPCAWIGKIALLLVLVTALEFTIFLEISRLKSLKRDEKSKKEVNDEN